MLTVLIIIGSIVVVGALAYFIVNKTSSKTRPIISIILWLLIIFLGYKIYTGIMAPIKFDKEKKKRYALVIDNLKIIRDAQVAHKRVTGDYAKKPADLISFIDTAKFAITNIRNEIVTETRTGGITVDVEKRVVDTVGFDPVIDVFKDRNYKNMFKVPGTDVNFDLETGYLEKVQGLKSPVFMAKVAKEVVLKGLDRNLIKAEKEAFGGPEVAGEYISVGSLDDVKESGNWPPSYDTKEEKENNK